jgi:tetratricopeptide (TPR) repeat protein
MRRYLGLAVCLLALPAAALPGLRGPGPRVEEAIGQYEAGEYAAAAEAFAQALETHPEHPRLVFGLAAALAAGGQIEQAAERYASLVASPDREVAVRARYNLGCLVAQQARALLGDRPERAPLEARQEGLERLTRASRHFRDCLRLDDHHADARHNLEITRLWIGRVRGSLRDSAPAQGKPTTRDGGGSAQDSQAKPKPVPPDGKPERAGPNPRRTPPDADDAPPKRPGDAGVSDPVRQQVERLISKVRQRTQERRQWDRQRPSDPIPQVEEKDW